MNGYVIKVKTSQGWKYDVAGFLTLNLLEAAVYSEIIAQHRAKRIKEETEVVTLESEVSKWIEQRK